ncbi:MAG: hypothetical protein J3Q66DRAFT_333209 [Benniella sp.]|nr:MAG: hypothetical protein J3Q66DRAFT_333209 [Benniella sp.]
MKFIASVAVAASSLVALATADLLQINNPTQGTVWAAGESVFVGWSGNCNSMGAAATNVTVDIVTGPAAAVRYVATLGHLDCSGANVKTNFVVPPTIESGEYALIVRTTPQPSFTNAFRINNGAAPPPAQTTGAPPPTSTTPTDDKSGASSLFLNGAVAIAGAVAVAFQLL